MDSDVFGLQSASGSMPEAEAKVDKMLNTMDHDEMMKMLLKKIML